MSNVDKTMFLLSVAGDCCLAIGAIGLFIKFLSKASNRIYYSKMELLDESVYTSEQENNDILKGE